ncbi:MAG: patatin-like phospholipase family protein [Spirochaetia bacterium]|nr:patatin-like phospholipase family protein [Spirochaetia bacterium]
MELVYTLSGGAAYGYAHVGVLRYLEEWGLRPTAIVGTSMGAIVGGLYAYGYDSKQIQQVAEQVRSIEIVKLFFPSFPRGGIIDTDGIRDFFHGFIQDALIEDLPVSYRSVAVDINTGQQVIFDRGRLLDAMMASMSIPTVFKPYSFHGHQLIDGGVLNNLPWRIAEEFGRLQVVVDVAPKRREDAQRVLHASELIETEAKDEAKRQVEEEHQKEISDQDLSDSQKSAFRKLEDRLTNGAFRIPLQKLADTLQSRETFSVKDLVNSFTRGPDHKAATLTLPEVITNVMAIINEQQTAEPEGGFFSTYAYIHPDLEEYYLNDFNKADEIIEQGYNEALTNPQFVQQVRKIAKKAGRR